MDRLVAAAPFVAAGLVLSGCASGPTAASRETSHQTTARDEMPADSVGSEPAASADVDRIDAAIQRFAHDRAGRLPVTLDELAKEKSPDGVSYVRTLGRDPWGRPYAYAVMSVRAGSYDLRSYGPDTLPGTGDDVVARSEPVMPK